MKNLLFVLVAFACNSGVSNNLPVPDSTAHYRDTSKDNGIVDTTTLGGSWYLIPVLPSDTAAGRLPQLIFNTDASRVTGNTGCNNMSATFTRTDSSITINGNITLTKMACPGYNEQAFIESLLQTNNYRFERGELILMFNETDLSRWSRKPTEPPKVNRI